MQKLEVSHICRRCLDRHYKVHLSHRDVREMVAMMTIDMIEWMWKGNKRRITDRIRFTCIPLSEPGADRTKWRRPINMK